MKDDEKPRIFEYKDDKGSDITFELYPSGHLRMIMDFAKDMSEEEFFKFTETCKYKPIRAPLRLIKK